MAVNDQMEIACHGNYHICDLSDAQEGERKLREWLKIVDSVPLGYSVPNSSISKEAEIQGEWKDFRYVRTGPMYGARRWLQVFCRKFCRVIPMVALYRELSGGRCSGGFILKVVSSTVGSRELRGSDLS